ncbi:MAG: hypothetical protein NC078_02060 [Ruminococcus sp.]|nr:hypothetical protein [Ruminococcus sp.]
MSVVTINGLNGYGAVNTAYNSGKADGSGSGKKQARSLRSFCDMLEAAQNKDTFTPSVSAGCGCGGQCGVNGGSGMSGVSGKPEMSTPGAGTIPSGGTMTGVSSAGITSGGVDVDTSSLADTGAKLRSVSEAIKNTDYSGMTKAEIYADLEKKYEETFEDFQVSVAMPLCTDHIEVCDRFREELKNHGIVPMTDKIYREAKGYTDMSYEEIEAAVKEKYAGKTGFFDQLNLFCELYRTGVLDDKYGSKEAFVIRSRFGLSLEMSGESAIPKSEWLARVQQTGATSPFTLFVNYPYFSDSDRDFYRSVVDDILFGMV